MLLIGDSHNSKITHRFQQLYKESLLKFTPFPTLVSLVRWGMFDYTRDDLYAQELILKFVDKHRPQRVMLTKHWLQVWCDDLDKPLNVPAKCDMKRTDDQLSKLTHFIK